MTVTANDLAKRYGDRYALKGVSFAAGAGERLAVIGPNGAGKTTLLSILAGIVEPTEGRVEGGGDTIGWVPQQVSVYGKLSVAENLRLFARLEKVPDADAAVDRALEQTGLAQRARDELGTLSGGNKQRVNIAVGLLGDPPVLLLDEPSSALDPRHRQRVWTLLDEQAQAGRTILFATHDLAEAARHADRVLVLADGELLFGGTPAELRTRVGDDAAHVDFEAAFVAFLGEQGH
jgi:ABC-2 type transport system ATP-binding protein